MENGLADLSLDDEEEENGEDLMKIPLVFSTFWVQDHELPPGLFLEFIAKQLVNPMLRLHLEIDMRNFSGKIWEETQILGQINMEHDVQERTIEGGYGNKRPR
ncbi:hypothetical protein Goarm_018714 [Gossypium armourianum]|uniref:Uncharacterized protein n=1 Tax=Gossypium armourianum TaxID=34283 RepID=A0A7J9IIE3_9ROSI|nr:hypothetical protein [Gossypium armourianum]